MTHRTTDAEILRRLNGEAGPPVTNWKPDVGEVLIGEVVDFDEVNGEYGPYPVVIVKPDDGERLAWSAKPVVARAELAKAAPEVGDRIAIRYDGVAPGRSYHLFKVALGRARRIDWSIYRRTGKSS